MPEVCFPTNGMRSQTNAISSASCHRASAQVGPVCGLAGQTPLYMEGAIKVSGLIFIKREKTGKSAKTVLTLWSGWPYKPDIERGRRAAGAFVFALVKSEESRVSDTRPGMRPLATQPTTLCLPLKGWSACKGDECLFFENCIQKKEKRGRQVSAGPARGSETLGRTRFD